jgi:YNFM family putative membrane transporter
MVQHGHPIKSQKSFASFLQKKACFPCKSLTPQKTGYKPISETATEIERIVPGTPAYRRLAWALLMAGFSTFALMYDVQPLLPVFARSFGVSAAIASLAVSFSTGALALALIPAGVLSDRIGRRPVMVASLFSSAALTLVSALLPGWPALLALRAAIGLALAGVPSVAMAYVSEEVAPASVGAAMGLYIAGSAIGGMTGRLGVTLVSQFAGWRPAIGVMGAAGLIAATAFALFAPQPRAFSPVRHDARSLLAATARLLSDKALPWLYAEGFLLMGAFVTIYNYVGFRLEAPPYRLSQAEVGSIFLLYLIGSFSSAWFGGLAGRVGRRKVFWGPIAVLMLGIGLTSTRPLWAIILGIAVITGAFFAAHSTASGWVGRRATRDRAQAAALYLLFYYLGSSVLGSAGGVAWTKAGWPGVAAYGALLVLAALAIAGRLVLVKPLGDDIAPSGRDN